MTKQARGDKAKRVVCIDPGHPSEGSDGCISESGLREVDVNWAVAMLLRAELAARGIEVVLTKQTANEMVSNIERARIANRSSADLMIRLHCDTGVGRGFAVYYPDRAVTKDGKTGPPPEVRQKSERAAKIIHRALVRGCGESLHDNGVKTDAETEAGRRQGGVLTASLHAEVPLVLVEMVFLSDPDDVLFISSPKGQAVMANALTEGIVSFLGQ